MKIRKNAELKKNKSSETLSSKSTQNQLKFDSSEILDIEPVEKLALKLLQWVALDVKPIGGRILFSNHTSGVLPGLLPICETNPWEVVEWLKAQGHLPAVISVVQHLMREVDLTYLEQKIRAKRYTGPYPASAMMMARDEHIARVTRSFVEAAKDSGVDVDVPKSVVKEPKNLFNKSEIKLFPNVEYLNSEHSSNPLQKPNWQLVASGYWYEDTYHSGHIAYFLAKTGPQEWTMESVERNALLDGVTQEDVDEGILNDDQIQSMWGSTLEEAQKSEYRQLVCTYVDTENCSEPEVIAKKLYRQICDSGGKEIDEFDSTDGLLD